MRRNVPTAPIPEQGRASTGVPGLVAAPAAKELPDPAAVDADTWRAYWRRWPIAAWAGELRGDAGRWFEVQGRRLVPTFAVDIPNGGGKTALAPDFATARKVDEGSFRGWDGVEASYVNPTAEKIGKPRDLGLYAEEWERRKDATRR